jgi:hypothetical protein
MRSVVLSIFLLLGLSLSVFAGDYIRVGVDSVLANKTNVEIPFYLERTCPTPARIMTINNAFHMTTAGDASFTLELFDCAAILTVWFEFACVPCEIVDSAGVFYTASVALPMQGMPVVGDTFAFILRINTGPGEGELLIDSTTFGTATWRWWGLTCGQGGTPERPLFVDKYGNDAVHPIRIVVYRVCGDVDGSGNVDIDDIIAEIGYIFGGAPPPPRIEDGDVDCSDFIDIDDVVYLINFVFGNGHAPCDPDGDGQEDC